MVFGVRRIVDLMRVLWEEGGYRVVVSRVVEEQLYSFWTKGADDGR